jgi:SPP1 family predicted phage head-tail adaptor
MSTSFPAITDAGRLDRRIRLQTFTETVNEWGEVIPTWSDLAEVWAQRRVLAGREVYESGQEQAVVDTRFLIRDRPGIEPRMRLIDGAWTYDILAVLPQGREEGLELLCRARDQQAPLPGRR